MEMSYSHSIKVGPFLVAHARTDTFLGKVPPFSFSTVEKKSNKKENKYFDVERDKKRLKK